MINLLPYDLKKGLKAARVNSILLRYIIVLLISGAFLGLAGLGLNVYMDMTKTSIEDIVNTAAAETNSPTDLTTKVNELKQKLASAKAVVDSGTKYSSVLAQLGKVTPTGAVLDKLSLSNSDFGRPIQLQFYAKTNEIANSIDDSFAGSTQFSGATLGNATTISNPPYPDYPVGVTLTVTINKEAS